ncbi:MAG: ABC transporter ATP-binding protein [Anaerolineae bacterium]|nr:ABC transporter ATP-binding protein [Anaerolineae bacterium]
MPQGPVWPILRRLLGYMRPHLLLFGGVFLALLASTVIELAPPWITRYAIDTVIPGAIAREIWLIAGAVVAVALVQGMVDFVRSYLTAYTGQRIIFGIRTAVYEHLSRLSFSFYDQARTGDLMSRVTGDVDSLSQFFSRSGITVVTNAMTIIGILVVMVTWSPRLALLYLLMIPFMAHAMWVYARRVRPMFAQARRYLATLTATLRETLVGIQVVKLFGAEAREAVKVEGQSRAYRDANIEASRTTSFWMPYTQVLVGAFTGVVLWYGGSQVIQGAISLGMLVGFTSYIAMLMRPIRQTGMMLASVLQAVAAAERVFEVLDTEPDIRDAPDAYDLPATAGHVRFHDVGFAYTGGARVLDGVSFEAKPGQMIALVGPSGAGKTTAVHLIPRFYDVEEGAVTIDGHDVRSVTIKSLREAVGVAMQDVFVFDASLRENIAYGRPGASQDEIEGAAQAVQLHEFIVSLPQGYDTPVGERGVQLSGGQRQRLALARVLLRNSPILIFDEPTSSVDAATETEMQQALDKARQGRTTFVIAHRLWTVQRADQILVLAYGRIIERGESKDGRSAHDWLIEAGGPYGDLVRQQMRDLAVAPEKQTSSRMPGRGGGGGRGRGAGGGPGSREVRS